MVRPCKGEGCALIGLSSGACTLVSRCALSTATQLLPVLTLAACNCSAMHQQVSTAQQAQGGTGQSGQVVAPTLLMTWATTLQKERSGKTTVAASPPSGLIFTTPGVARSTCKHGVMCALADWARRCMLVDARRPAAADLAALHAVGPSKEARGLPVAAADNLMTLLPPSCCQGLEAACCWVGTKHAPAIRGDRARAPCLRTATTARHQSIAWEEDLPSESGFRSGWGGPGHS